MKYLATLLIGFSIISCHRNNNNTGYDYMPDMFYSKAYETNAANPIFEDGKTQREPVAGTIPRGEMPYTLKIEDRTLAGTTYHNPLQNTKENLTRGKEVYNIYCLNCHGEKGDGQGNLFLSKKYPFPPASLTTNVLKDTPDGELYHVITMGQGVMGEQGSLIRPEDRWKVINYIRNKLQNN